MVVHDYVIIFYYSVGGILIRVQLLIKGVLIGVWRYVKGGVLVGVEFLFDGNMMVCFTYGHVVFYEIN